MVVLILTPSLFLCGIRGRSTVLKESEVWEFVKALGTVLSSTFLEFRKLPHLTDVSTQFPFHFLFFLDLVFRAVHKTNLLVVKFASLFVFPPFCTLQNLLLWPVDISSLVRSFSVYSEF